MLRFLVSMGAILTTIAVIEFGATDKRVAPQIGVSWPQGAMATLSGKKNDRFLLREIKPHMQAAVTIGPSVVNAVTDQPPRSSPLKSQAIADANAKHMLLSPYEMKKAAQIELQRLSCYKAAIDGIWGRRSRAAVRLFNKRSNASFRLNESVELLTALKRAPDGLCSSRCQGNGACDVVASNESKAEDPAQAEKTVRNDEGPSYLPPWMRGKTVAEVVESNDTEVTERFSVTQTSATDNRVRRARPVRRKPRAIYRAPKRKKNWLPKDWPGVN